MVELSAQRDAKTPVERARFGIELCPMVDHVRLGAVELKKKHGGRIKAPKSCQVKEHDLVWKWKWVFFVAADRKQKGFSARNLLAA